MIKAKDILNPFPGLRPFSFEDRKYYFGRKTQIKDIVKKVLKERFTAITGSSGTGKSSLINAGIIPLIYEEFNNEDETSWRIISLKPGTAPIDSLSAKIAENISNTGVNDTKTGQPDKISRLLHNSPDGLTEALKQSAEDSKEKVLLIIDQFEDLFIFKQSQKNYISINECEKFINLILETHKQDVIPVYLILSIRSDFIEEFQRFPYLINLINSSNYFLPEMTREEMQEAINRPAALFESEIDPELEQKLLDDIIDNPNKLPLLQHSLNRIWEQWLTIKDKERPVSLKDYEAVGGIENSLIQHLEETYEQFTDNDRLVCERIFRTITEKGTDYGEISIPVRIAYIANITGFGVNKIIDIAESFRQPNSSLLLPTHKVKLNSETILELTHESILRLWPRLQKWMREEEQSIILYKRLAKAAKSYQLGQETILDTSELQEALQWQEVNNPTFEWARQYDPAYELTMQYITLSKEVLDEEEMVKDRKTRKLIRYTSFVAVISVLILASLGFFFLIPSGSRLKTHDQPELLHLRDIPGFEPLDFADTPNNELAVPDEVFPDQPAESHTDQGPAGRRVIQEQAIRNQRGTEEAIVPEHQSSEGSSDQTDPEEELAREEAMRRRIVSASQTLALISQQIENDTDLKALLTVQSHIFNEKYNRASYNPDIYSGLFSSVKDLYGSDYNAFKGHTASVNSLVFRPNSSVFYSASLDGTVRQWDLNNESKTPKTLIQDQVLYNKLAISPNARWLAAATDGMGIKVFDTGIGRPDPVMVNWGNNRIVTLDFYPDNQHILFAGSDNDIIKYNFISATSQILATTDSEVLSLSLSPDGETIVAGTRSGQVLLFSGDADPSGRIIHYDPGNDVHTVNFNKSGTRVVAGSLKGEVRILEVSSGNLVATLRGHSARVVDVKFCPEDKFIASASFDGTIHLRNVQNLGARPVVLGDHGSWVRTLAFNTAGDKMVTGSRQETRLLSWSINANDMASMICAIIRRNLTTEEWNKYLGEDILYRETCPQLSGR